MELADQPADVLECFPSERCEALHFLLCEESMQEGVVPGFYSPETGACQFKDWNGCREGVQACCPFVTR